ncbi:bifunctional acetate--CoA ligase family protein/GNAT family N-acetyltransferase [Limnochorda pilosa]|uniref:N-acetyltransferase domain-containing protein n=1 Tax=Limnochorda pilosa TaxID=1555112 RepID=A0A0K2SH32_LIMPI|nr:GNAT family N-acetyltransferase [Limnochorda pilosa]BAS26134.1 hypothetical protein LIP_0277 [Limnochorda pilosa]
MARVILRDGTVADLRPARNDHRDRSMLRELFRNASAESRYFRFFTSVGEVDAKWIEQMVTADGVSALSLVCVAGDHILGIGNYVRSEPADTAEVAFFVDDRYHGKGLGTLLLEHLAQAAWRNGLKRFEAFVLRDNHKMMQVFHDSGFEAEERWDPKNDPRELRVVLPLGETERTRALQATREKLATAASLQPFFRPQSVAVVGASRDPDRLGHALFRHILDGGFQGTVYPVNPSARSVAAVRSYPSLKEVPEPVDLAVVVVPAAQVLAVVDEAVEAGVRGVLVTSAGFSETGAVGLELERQALHRLRDAGIRLIGPNCLGLLNTHPEVRFNASFAPTLPRRGRVAIASHSGALGIAILEYASRIGVGVSSFASLGNKPDVSGNDLLQYWADDPDTEMIILYLESFGNPRKFSRICREITPHKPILAVKGARTAAGLAVSEKRTVAVAASDVVVEGLFRQAGIIRADTLEDLFDAAALLAAGPLPEGRRVAVVTNTAGGAVITVDALPGQELELARPPIDLGFEALAEGYRAALPELLRDPDVDAVIVLFIPVGTQEEEAVAQAIVDAVQEVAGRSDLAAGRERFQGIRKPIVANFLMSPGGGPVRYLEAEGQRIPVYPFPERAVRALGAVARYAEFRRRPRGRVPDLPGADSGQARALAREVLAGAASPPEEGLWLEPEQTAALLGAMGIRLSPDGELSVPASHTAAAVFERDGNGSGEAGQPGAGASEEPRKAPLARLALGVAYDRLFGPVIGAQPLGVAWQPGASGEPGETPAAPARGAGATAPPERPLIHRAPLVRITPLTDLDAHEMARAALSGFTPAVARACAEGLADLLLRLSRLAEEVPEVVEVDLPEVDLTEAHCSARGASVRVAPATSLLSRPARPADASHGH